MSGPTKGAGNWNKHWKGKGNIVTSVRKPGPYFDDPKSRKTGLGYLRASTEKDVIYIDSLSQEMESNQNRVAFQFGDKYDPEEEVYYTQIDNFRKPGRSAYSGIFKPQQFGLKGAEFTLNDYITTLKNSIISRTDIVGELEEYLLSLVEFADKSILSSGFDYSNIPLADIRNDFGECIGPIYALRRGLATFNLGINVNSKIYFPPASNEPFLDYILTVGISPNVGQIKVSAKSQGVNTNTLKVESLIPLIEQNSTLLSQIQQKPEYRVMKIINNNGYVMGPIRCAEFLNIITSEAVNSVSRIVSGAVRIPKPELFLDVIQNDQRLSSRLNEVRNNNYSGVIITLNEISYACEKLIVNYSKSPVHTLAFTDIIRKALSNEMFFVHLSLNNGIPNFSVRRSNGVAGQSLSNLYLRSKNGYDLKKDKLGFAV